MIGGLRPVACGLHPRRLPRALPTAAIGRATALIVC